MTDPDPAFDPGAGSVFADEAAVQAVHGQRLPEFAAQRLASDPNSAVARRAGEVCRRIGTQLEDQIEQLRDHLSAAGLTTVEFEHVSSRGSQRHELVARAQCYEDAGRAAALAAELGYQRWEAWDGSAERCFAHLGEPIRMGLPAQARMAVLRLDWPATSPLTRLPRLLKPTAADLHSFHFPERLWPLYVLTRPIRLVAERLLSRQPAALFGPPLSTPTSLLPGLFAFADIGPDDVVADIGCGDGRVVIAAARRLGCRSVGIEADPTMAALARNNVAEAGLDDRVQIIDADAAATGPPPGTTVAFLFLPAEAAASMVPTLLSSLGPGGRVIAHEQTPLIASVPPEVSAVVFGDDSLTVAHRWSR